MTRAHWTLGLAAAFVAAVGGAFLARGGNAARGSSYTEKNETPTAAANPTPVAAAPATAKPVEPVAAAAKSSEERARLLEALGTLTAAHYFQTYLNIGFIADGKTRGTYTDRDARKVLDSVLSLLNSTERKLEALGQIELSRGDRARLEELQAVSALLRQQGKELQAYWDAGKDENATRYESLRQNAWASILKLMGTGQ